MGCGCVGGVWGCGGGVGMWVGKFVSSGVSAPCQPHRITSGGGRKERVVVPRWKRLFPRCKDFFFFGGGGGGGEGSATHSPPSLFFVSFLFLFFLSFFLVEIRQICINQQKVEIVSSFKLIEVSWHSDRLEAGFQ